MHSLMKLYIKKSIIQGGLILRGLSLNLFIYNINIHYHIKHMSIIYFPENIKPNLDKVDEKGKFVDETFPHDINAIFNNINPMKDKDFKYDENYNNKFEEEKLKLEEKIKTYQMKWKRISDIINEETDEKNKNVPINQNELGDCYLIAFLR